MWSSHVEAVVSATHSNGPEGQKCFNPHGHDWKVEVEIDYLRVDRWGWGPSFGEVKDVIRQYDHGVNGDLTKMLAPAPPSAENFAVALWNEINETILESKDYGVIRMVVTVHEGDGNRVRWSGGVRA